MKFLKNYFTIWWIPIISYLIPISVYILGTIFKSDNIIDIFLIVFFINILGTIISSIVQIVIKKWYFIFPQITVSVLLFFYVSFIFTFSPPDYYGANKTIPKNIEISEPMETEPAKDELRENEFVIQSSFQPGIYNYYVKFKPTNLGNLYVKAYEITSNDKLSEDRIKLRSKILIESLEEKVYSGKFTIYEGSWGDKYGARIELWFEPKNGEGEYKIAEKNYIVEGWMR